MAGFVFLGGGGTRLRAPCVPPAKSGPAVRLEVNDLIAY